MLSVQCGLDLGPNLPMGGGQETWDPPGTNPPFHHCASVSPAGSRHWKGSCPYVPLFPCPTVPTSCSPHVPLSPYHAVLTSPCSAVLVPCCPSVPPPMTSPHLRLLLGPCRAGFAFPPGICSQGTQGKLGGYFFSRISLFLFSLFKPTQTHRAPVGAKFGHREKQKYSPPTPEGFASRCCSKAERRPGLHANCSEVKLGRAAAGNFITRSWGGRAAMLDPPLLGCQPPLSAASSHTQAQVLF